MDHWYLRVQLSLQCSKSATGTPQTDTRRSSHPMQTNLCGILGSDVSALGFRLEINQSRGGESRC